MRRNLIFIRAGDTSLHRTWLAPRAERNYDLFVSYSGANLGTFQNNGEFYEAASGPKFHVFGRLLSEKPELVSSYSAIWAPDDDMLTSAALINRMFELFAKYKLLLAQPALAPGSYWSHKITRMIRGKLLHFSRFVEVTCPIFDCSILKKLAPTFSLNASNWGIDFLWPYLLNYPPKRVAILDETPVMDTCPADKEQDASAQADYDRIVKRYHIDCDTVRSRVFGSIRQRSKPRRSPLNVPAGLLFLQKRIDKACNVPIFYEYRANKLKNRERLNSGGSRGSPSNGASLTEIGRRNAAKLKKIMSSKARLETIAKDFLKHWAARKPMREGKAMLVCMDQQICFSLQKKLDRLRPAWKQGTIKVLIDAPKLPKSQGKHRVITESRQSLVERFRNPQDPLELVITNSMWLDDLDCPLLNTIYVDVPIPFDRHIDAIGRLMHAFRNRPGTLMVDYFGLADGLFHKNTSTSLRPAQPAARGAPTTVQAPLGASAHQNGHRVREEGGLERTRPGRIGGERRIAHLFLIRNNLNHEEIWRKFFKGHESKYSIYVHAKWPEQMTSELLRGRQIPKRCDTKYADASLVKAELLLLEEAFKNRENYFFLLHSESCLPIRPFDYVYSQLFNKGRSWLYYYKDDMYRYYGVEMSVIPPTLFFKASQFFCLTRDHVATILANGKLKHWRHCECADEHYIPSTLAMSGKLQECLRRSLTFVDWNLQRRESPAGPTTFHKLLSSDVEALLRTKALFARKFAPDSDISRHIAVLHSGPGNRRLVRHDSSSSIRGRGARNLPRMLPALKA